MFLADVQNEHHVYRFGPFELDPAQRRLRASGERIYLADRPMDILLCLLAHAGRIVDKETLIRTAWPETAVGDESLRQAVNALRQALGRQRDEAEYIATRFRRGYEFMAPVERIDDRLSHDALDDELDPFRAFVDGCAALDTFRRNDVDRARAFFETAMLAGSGVPAAHIGLANACFLSFESTRTDSRPAREQLTLAAHHAREACRLLPASGHAWGTLALIRHRLGYARDARAASRKAIALEPGDWRHYLRHAAVSWGEERCRAAYRALSLNSDLPLAHWFAAMVFVARGQLDRALEELRSGCDLQDARDDGHARFSVLGLRWLLGLVLATRGAEDEAHEQLRRELAATDDGHVYGREAGANAWYAIGALRLRQGRRDEAMAAMQEALRLVPCHPMAMMVAGGPQGPAYEDDSVEASIVKAAALVLEQRHYEAARLCGDALWHAPPGSAGWHVPVEPLLQPHAHPEAWASTLATLRARAF